MTTRPPYIVLEGTDGCGKDTQAELLCNWFREQGFDPLLLNEPDDSLPTGQLLRQMLRNGTYPKAHAAMFLADRMAMLPERVTPALDSGRPVVCCRSFLSTLVYQQEHWPLDWLFTLHAQLPEKPTHLIVLDIPAEESMARIGKRGGPTDCYEKLEIQRRVRQRYCDVMNDRRLVQKVFRGDSVCLATIDGNRTINEIQDHLRSLCREETT